MPAPKTIPDDVVGTWSSHHYVVIKDGRVIHSGGCSLRAFPAARRNNAAIYDGYTKALIEDYTDDPE